MRCRDRIVVRSTTGCCLPSPTCSRLWLRAFARSRPLLSPWLLQHDWTPPLLMENCGICQFVGCLIILISQFPCSELQNGCFSAHNWFLTSAGCTSSAETATAPLTSGRRALEKFKTPSSRLQAGYQLPSNTKRPTKTLEESTARTRRGTVQTPKASMTNGRDRSPSPSMSLID